jgi:hypothetical protein
MLALLTRRPTIVPPCGLQSRSTIGALARPAKSADRQRPGECSAQDDEEEELSVVRKSLRPRSGSCASLNAAPGDQVLVAGVWRRSCPSE